MTIESWGGPSGILEYGEERRAAQFGKMESAGCAKRLLMGANLLFVLAVVGLMSASLVVHTSFRAYLSFLGVRFSVATIFVAVGGAAVLMVAALGFLGAARTHSALLLVFASALLAACLVELGGAAVGFATSGALRRDVSARMRAAQASYGATSAVTAAWDRVQREFGCCGVTNHTDWFAYFGDLVVPDSCCRRVTALCGTRLAFGEPIYSRDCIGGFCSWASSRIVLLSAMGVVLAVLQAVVVGLALSLYRLWRKYETVEN